MIITAVTLLVFFLPLSSQAQTAVPTRDRLAAPPTVPAPTQADEGAQLYWLHCQPCHGDVGQGLTDAPDDDWRAQYPEEDGNCWDSGCHGSRPYEEGFTLPKQVPAVIGEEALARFDTMEEMHTFMKVAMPFQAPATLTETEYLQISAFLIRENEIENNQNFTVENLATIQPHATYNEVVETPVPTTEPLVKDNILSDSTQSNPAWMWLVGGIVIVMLGLGGLIWRHHIR